MSEVKAVVTGAAGRMGSMIARIIHETGGITLSGAVEREGNPALGRDAGEFAGTGPLGVHITDDLEGALAESDVVIDFTSAETSLANLDLVSRLDKALVIGSTGFSQKQKQEIRSRTDARIFFTPNMSMGMNLLFTLVHAAAKLLGDQADVEIIETHHRFKKDSPSGSAKWLAEAAALALGRDPEADAVHGREGLVGERTTREIGMHAVRAGDVVGDHTVVFGMLGERLELTHKATSRETFARGAVRAALWLPSQAPGCYDMMDLLGLEV